jgi:dipeptidyl-peptidase-3
MKKNVVIMFLGLALLGMACQSQKNKEEKNSETFQYVIDRFADIEIMRYQVDNWDKLSLQQKELIYYLSEAARCGRDIIFDQNGKYNLTVKRTLENIVNTYSGDKNDDNWKAFMVYVKRFWFSNGMHHHYSNAKFYPEISTDYFENLLNNSSENDFPVATNQSFGDFKKWVTDIIFNENIEPLKICQDVKKDLVTNSAVNFYENVTQKEVEKYYADLKKNDINANKEEPISYGLNTKVTKDKDGRVVELPWKVGGLYGPAIEKIVYWLEKASTVAENEEQKNHILKLIEYYTSGDLKTWDDYNILWVKDVNSLVDYVNGFIEVYTYRIVKKATWEAVVNFKDLENNKRTELISENAQWFEDNSPIDAIYKKKEVKGVMAKVITVAQLGGECYPATPIGINLPNANWIRKHHGSKSVTMSNIMYAYHQARMKNGSAQEFYYSEKEIELAKKYGYEADNLQVDLHECLGHGSGQMLPGIEDGMLKNYHSPIEETRADLFSLYYIADDKMLELNLLPDPEAYKACYYKYILNGMMLQLNRINLGDDISQAHMRNRALIANWCYENGLEKNVIEKVMKNGKTYIKINDYVELRKLFAQLLAEIQKIKSTGDYEAARKIVETYGVKIDYDIHKEVKERFAPLNIAPYGGFINPEFKIVKKGDKIVDIQIEYPNDYTQQMLEYSKKYSYLP